MDHPAPGNGAIKPPLPRQFLTRLTSRARP